MADFPITAHKYRALVVIPIWVGLLTLPFAGFGSAGRALVTAAAMMVLWKLFQMGALAAVRRSAIETLSDFFASFRTLARFVNVPFAYALFIVFLIALPVFLNDYYRDILTLTGMYIVLALGLNIVVGQAGLLNLGYVAFYAIGAYTYAILSTTFGLSFWFGLLAGGSVAAVFAVLLGMPILRLRGDYFAIVTLGLGEITRIILNNWDTMTGGPNGISKIGRPVIA
jgi:hypothetical protein